MEQNTPFNYCTHMEVFNIQVNLIYYSDFMFDFIKYVELRFRISRYTKEQ